MVGIGTRLLVNGGSSAEVSVLKRNVDRLLKDESIISSAGVTLPLENGLSMHCTRPFVNDQNKDKVNN